MQQEVGHCHAVGPYAIDTAQCDGVGALDRDQRVAVDHAATHTGIAALRAALLASLLSTLTRRSGKPRVPRMGASVVPLARQDFEREHIRSLDTETENAT